MATPRRTIIDPEKPCVCHCVSRCVRRLFLLGDRAPASSSPDDAAPSPSREPDFWKTLVSLRIVQLVALFAIDVIESSIMSNHIHLLLATPPDLVALWTDEEVAARWRTLTPDYHWRRRKGVAYDAPAQREEIDAILKDAKALAHARRVLADVSHFHKFLKQRIAQLANAEDDVTGRFWEGRFKSIVATDAASVVAHMVYIALNPVRAGLAASLEECAFSSIRGRIEELKRRIDAGEFQGEVEAAKEKLRGLALLPALPCDPGERVRGLETLPENRPNPWRKGEVPPVVEGLTVAAYLDHAERIGRLERIGKASLSHDRPTALATLEGRIQARLGARPRGVGASTTPAATPSGLADGVMRTAASYAAPVEAALSRGLANAFGNFSGGVRSVARRAAELGRRAVWAIFDPDGLGPQRWVGAERELAE